MSPNEYRTACDHILTSTMQYINPSNIPGYNIDKAQIQGDPVYTSAVADAAGITLVYAPAGTGKSRLIYDRAVALLGTGLIPQDITVLNMNVAKTEQMAKQMPGANVMTFNDFVHGLFSANIPCIRPSDRESVIASLRLMRPEDSNTAANINRFIQILSIRDPQEQSVKTTLFVNANLDFILDTLNHIKKADSALEAMIAQNQVYQFTRDPYETKAILVNGVQNMPLPVLCVLLQYANMYKCNLFLTGDPQETIYDFNMAYGNAMNTLSAFDGHGLHLIRLTNASGMAPDIKKAVDMDPYAKIPASSVDIMRIDMSNGMTQDAMLQQVFGRGNRYLLDCIGRNEQLLIMGRSKQDISQIHTFLQKEYAIDFPTLKITDLTALRMPDAQYGPLLAKYYDALRGTYPSCISMGTLFMELYNILAMEESVDDPRAKQKFAKAKSNLPNWTETHTARFNGMHARLPIRDAIQLVIDIEAEDIQTAFNTIRGTDSIQIPDSGIILSTIHAAVDIRADNVLLYARTMSDYPDENLYRVAMSRARKTELAVFINTRRQECTYERYLKNHIVKD